MDWREFNKMPVDKNLERLKTKGYNTTSYVVIARRDISEYIDKVVNDGPIGIIFISGKTRLVFNTHNKLRAQTFLVKPSLIISGGKLPRDRLGFYDPNEESRMNRSSINLDVFGTETAIVNTGETMVDFFIYNDNLEGSKIGRYKIRCIEDLDGFGEYLEEVKERGLAELATLQILVGSKTPFYYLPRARHKSLTDGIRL